MSSDPRRLPPAVRRTLPWLAWAAAAVTAAAMNLAGQGLGNAPATAEVHSVSLSSPTALRVISVDVKVGDLVSQGQLVARLDPTKADAALIAAKGELEKLKLKAIALTNFRVKAAGREAAVGWRLSLEVGQLDADEKRDRSELTQLDAQIDRQTRLVGEKLASADQLNELNLKRAALAERVTAYGALLQRARAGQAASIGRLERWQGARAEAAGRLDETLAAMQSAIAAQDAYCQELEKVRLSLDLTAPFSGRVSELGARPMEAVRVGQPVVTIVDERPSMAVAYVDQSWATQVQVGDEVTLVPTDHSGPTRKGKVAALGPAISETPKRFQLVPGRLAFSREARVELEPSTAPVVPGQAFTAGFHRASAAVPSGMLGER